MRALFFCGLALAVLVTVSAATKPDLQQQERPVKTFTFQVNGIAEEYTSEGLRVLIIAGADGEFRYQFTRGEKKPQIMELRYVQPGDMSRCGAALSES